MNSTLSILLFAPKGRVVLGAVAESYQIHAFQTLQAVLTGLTHLSPSVIVTEYCEDGLDLCQTLMFRAPGLPVVMVGEALSEKEILSAVRAGARDIVDSTRTSWRVEMGHRLDAALAWSMALEKNREAEAYELREAISTAQRSTSTLSALLGEEREQRAAESALLIQTQRQLELQRELALAAVRAKGRFLANVSHELKTPLNAIIGYAELLLEDLVDEKRVDAQRIIQSANRLLRLLDGVLKLSRLEAGQVHPVFEPISVKDLLDRCVAAVRPAAKRGKVRLLVEPTEVDQVVSDPGRLIEALTHLLDNAVKFSPRGQVNIRVTRVRGSQTIVFEVSDNGIGVENVDLERIFHAFTQADGSETRDFEGVGLGLAISHQIARVLGGELTGSSIKGVGSRFSIRIPDVDTRASKAGVGQDLTILIVDDDPVLRMVLQRMLVADGHTVIATGDAEEALEIARQQRLSMITLDVMLPGVDGWTVLERLKADPELCEIPVMMLSANDNEERTQASDACAFLRKPINREALREIVATYATSIQAVLVVGRRTPGFLSPLVADGLTLQAVQPADIASSITQRLCAVVLSSDLPLEPACTVLEVLTEHPDVPVVVVSSPLPPIEDAFLQARFSMVGSEEQVVDEIRRLAARQRLKAHRGARAQPLE